jgi:phage/plasmid-like protein (TIGR03299 family)
VVEHRKGERVMAHEIDFTTGLPAVAYTGDVPWHGYGQAMPEDQTLDEWRVAAGLNWEVIPRRVMYNPGPAYVLKEYEARKILVRSDTRDSLSCVSSIFKVVQPAEVLQFFESLIEKSGFKMCTAGSLRGGRRIWAMAEAGEGFTIGGDRIDPYLLLATAYDGTFSTTAKFTTIRTVCNNTLEFGLTHKGVGGQIRIPHNQEFNPVDVKVALGLEEAWEQFRSKVTALTSHKVTKQQAIDYFLTVCGVSEREAADGKQLSNVKKLISIYETGPGAKLETVENTLWGCVNAVTYLADHGRRSKNNGTRFDSAAFGSGAALKNKAFAYATAIVEAA